MQGGMSENPQLQGVYIIIYIFTAILYVYIYILDIFLFDICTLSYVLSLGWAFVVAITKV